MSSHRTFEFEMAPHVEADRLLAEAGTRAKESGISMRGDATSGTFSGAAEGSYRVSGRKVQVEVRSKPVFIPWGIIESALRRLFS